MIEIYERSTEAIEALEKRSITIIKEVEIIEKKDES